MIFIQNNVTNFFENIFNDLDCQPDTKAYIVSIYAKYKYSDGDLSKDSVTLLFMQAQKKQNFSMFQNLGDWIFFANTMKLGHLKFASKNYYDTIARLSYTSCYKIINKKWTLFQELSDNFLFLENQVKNKFIINKLF